MGRTLGIIPAAGQSVRFGGVLKEMLPISDGVTLIKRTLTALHNGGCDTCLIVTNRDKLPAHAQHLKDWAAIYSIQRGRKNIWSAVAESLPIHGKVNLFAMPDTYYPADAFTNILEGDFALGVFETSTPERFGVLKDGKIVDKQVLPAGKYQAWGVLGWSDSVARYWISCFDEINSFDQAISMAMDKFGYTVKTMEYYRDLAGWSDYHEFMRGQP